MNRETQTNHIFQNNYFVENLKCYVLSYLLYIYHQWSVSNGVIEPFGRTSAIRFIIPGLFYFRGSQRGLLISGKEVNPKCFLDWVLEFAA